MAFEYSGWIEVPKQKDGSGEILRIPFNFQSPDILTNDERIERMKQLYDEWRAMLTDYDASREGNYGDIVRHRFTSLVDLDVQPATGSEGFGRT